VRAAERWLVAVWQVVRGQLPDPPLQVLEIGCGPLGGVVPMLRSSGYEALGVDPDAPSEEAYRRVEFEEVELPGALDVVVASTSLHHVREPAAVIDRIAAVLAPRGTLIVVEWDWEAFDEPTARWCFERLGSGEEPGWLHRRREEWAASAKPWGEFLGDWARAERLHAVGCLLRLIDERFERRLLARGPYFFADLPETTEDEERAAIEASHIRATRVDYSGMLRS
jgi:SAM-dependent methyltransferase